MTDKRRKDEIVTFKADRQLAGLLKNLPNKSQFIRNAIGTALLSICPLCSGKGRLSEMQRKHWEEFLTQHAVEECDGCREMHIVCLGESMDTSEFCAAGESGPKSGAAEECFGGMADA
ncbi:MAG: hypothetical protein CVV64_05400 [Candidatus Wallbacteria bacterium HGW-Wallbacteria-1]|uniref:CopG family transcriptional regulator n=1 Tax=Candidatus Wallbacteria bacterium HGW-Wallbacteria-1 TaxID=2013854 RepID=A0A2N1PS95_9BACT|nr:MAG: hypothetical protein CVV64_05400 [Candidatus Wallbacteria bacterium HGW-Wallbacteria-1]